MKRLLWLVIALLLLGGLWLFRAQQRATPQLQEITVERGDTLYRLAKRHGTTVAKLKEANGLRSDNIQVGQTLVLPGGGEAKARAKRPPSKRAAKRVKAPKAEPSSSKGEREEPLRMPKPKRCLPPPTELAEGQAVGGSQGLSQAQLSESLAAFFPRVPRCVEDVVPSGDLQLEILVGCDGLVKAVYIADDPGWPTEVSSCVQDTMRYTGFPAHDLPDGLTFALPVGFD